MTLNEVHVGNVLAALFTGCECDAPNGHECDCPDAVWFHRYDPGDLYDGDDQ